MINRGLLRSPGVLFFVLAICLLPLGIVSFHSNWPPLTWQHAHFADGDIGQTMLTCSGLFFVFALTYFFFPKIFHRQMNEKLGRFHFWANMVAVFLLLAFPIYFNLSFHSPPGESKTDRFFRALGASMESFVWEIAAVLIVQVLFLGNLLWSIFKGQKVFRPTTTESTRTSVEV